ncbi:MAG: hypothetical protein GXO23_07555 [Crenarchaeota archaeon]|nr:hypothetical protein [Thermoproteota archaeon]
MSQASEVVRKLVEGVVSKLTEEINSWRENLRLRAETELYEAAKSVIDKHASAIDELEKEIRLEREFRLYNTMMEIERKRLEFMENFVNKVIDAVIEKVKQLKGTDKYREYIKACLSTARYYIGSDELVVKCSQSDRDIVEAAASELKLKLVLETVPEELYGIKAASVDGKVALDLTLGTRLSLLREKIKGLAVRVS